MAADFLTNMNGNTPTVKVIVKLIITNKVLMKAGRSISDLQELLRRRGELEGASLVANCGMEGEQVFPRFAEMADPTGYFSLVLVKGREQG